MGTADRCAASEETFAAGEATMSVAEAAWNGAITMMTIPDRCTRYLSVEQRMEKTAEEWRPTEAGAGMTSEEAVAAISTTTNGELSVVASTPPREAKRATRTTRSFPSRAVALA